MKKRVSITVEAESYDEMMEKARSIGFKSYWYGREITRMNQVLSEVLDNIIEAHRKGKDLTKNEEIKTVIGIVEKAFGNDLAEIMRKAKKVE